MKRRSRFLALTCAAVMMAFVLAGCSKPTTENPDPGDNQTPENSDAKTYIVASDTAFPPFEYMNTDTGKYVGFDLDILAAVAEDQNFKYEVQHIGFDPACNAVSAGQADAVIAGMTITEERQKDYDFSDGYYQNGQIMAVSANSEIASMEDLQGKIVAAKIGTMGTAYADANKDKYGYTVKYYEDSPTMYEAVLNGANDACFEDEAVMIYGIENGMAMKMVGEAVNFQPYGFAVKKGENSELIQMFNDGLKNIRENGKYDEILERYGLASE